MNNIKRYAMITGIKLEKCDEYKHLHADPWPGVLDTLKRHHIQNYSIHLYGDYLFGYLEYAGSDFDKDMEKIGTCPITQKWWEETDLCQHFLREGQRWILMEEVFFMP